MPNKVNFIVVCTGCGQELEAFTVIVREDADGTRAFETTVEPHDCPEG